MDSLISPLSIAPMIDWTYTHFRVLMRLVAPKALLYTEMQTMGAIQYSPQKALGFDPMEHPLALQLGGSHVQDLVTCAQIAEKQGFCEINLNLGCPSDRVQSGRFGACMMAEPDLVAECIHAMKNAVSIPVTAKTRIGIDNQDSYEFFSGFVHKLVEAGCDKLIVHARKAWLHGLSPKQNRTVPPLNYDYAYQIRRDIPQHIPVVINGNINSYQEVNSHLALVDGVMLGRFACQNPYGLTQIHQQLFPNQTLPGRYEIIEHYLHYAAKQFEQGAPISLLIKPLLNFAYGLPGAKHWKELLIQAQQAKLFSKTLEALEILGELESSLV